MCYDHFEKVSPPNTPPPRKVKVCEHKFKFIEKMNYEYIFYCEKCLLIKNSGIDQNQKLVGP